MYYDWFRIPPINFCFTTTYFQPKRGQYVKNKIRRKRNRKCRK